MKGFGLNAGSLHRVKPGNMNLVTHCPRAALLRYSSQTAREEMDTSNAELDIAPRSVTQSSTWSDHG